MKYFSQSKPSFLKETTTGCFTASSLIWCDQLSMCRTSLLSNKICVLLATGQTLWIQQTYPHFFGVFSLKATAH